MNVFSHPNLSTNWTCPVCGTADDKETVLVAKHGTQERNLVQCEQIHLECLDLWIIDLPDGKILLQKIESKV